MNLLTLSRLTFLLVSTLFLCSCGPEATTNTDPAPPEVVDTVASTKDTVAKKKVAPPPVYANARFRNVKVVRQNDSTYLITGEAQVFEAAFSWVVEDGHDELMEGHEMTDAGAPVWGAFRFTISPKAQRANSTLTLVLFEYSAKDGSRQHELPIPLP